MLGFQKTRTPVPPFLEKEAETGTSKGVSVLCI